MTQLGRAFLACPHSPRGLILFRTNLITDALLNVYRLQKYRIQNTDIQKYRLQSIRSTDYKRPVLMLTVSTNCEKVCFVCLSAKAPVFSIQTKHGFCNFIFLTEIISVFVTNFYVYCFKMSLFIKYHYAFSFAKRKISLLLPKLIMSQ